VYAERPNGRGGGSPLLRVGPSLFAPQHLEGDPAEACLPQPLPRRALAKNIQDSVYYSMDERPLAFVGSSLEDLRAFPTDARRRAGFELAQVQHGLLPTDWKPMTSIGAGVMEIRLHGGVEHRVFYVAKFEEAVYVLHAFKKKGRKTSKRDVDLGRARLAALLAQRSTGQQ